MIAFFISFVLAVVFASLLEYWIHRLMHVSERFGARHRDHHRRNEGQGVVWEFRDYLKGSFIVLWPPFLISMTVGLGWLVGAIAYAAFSAYAHQLQHENPTKCFWMAAPKQKLLHFESSKNKFIYIRR